MREKNTTFEDFLGMFNGNTVRKPQGRATTEKQRRMYLDLCQRKRITPKDINDFTFETMYQEIDRLMKLPTPPSNEQLRLIKELDENIKTYYQKLKALSNEKLVEIIENTNNPELVEILKEGYKGIDETVLESLTGGHDGTASTLISELYKINNALNVVQPPSEEQIERLADWFFCPDIPFEDYHIYKRVRVHHPEHDNAWRLLTREEFKEEIRNKMTKHDANRFMGRYSGVFYEWKRTRITQEQKNLIRTLEERLSDTYMPPRTEVAIVNGVITQVLPKRSRNVMIMRGQEPLTDQELDQMSKEDATKFIDMLRAEIDRRNDYRDMYNESDIYDDSQQLFEDKFKIGGADGRERITDEKSAKDDEFIRLERIIIYVESITGVRDDFARDMIQEILHDGADSATIRKNKQYLHDFFMSSITAHPELDTDRWKEQMARIYNMCEDVPTALEILTKQF